MSKSLNRSTDDKWKNRRDVDRIPVYNTLAKLTLGINEIAPDEAAIRALALNISSRGCCLLTHCESAPETFSFCRVSIGQQIRVLSQVRWVQQVGPNLFKIGLCYQV
jgi:hypothetical protein